MMNRSIGNLKKYALLFTLLTLVGIALRCISLFGFYDSDIGYYQTAAVLPDIFHILSVLVIAVAFSSVFFLPKKDSFVYSSPSSDKGISKVGAVFVLIGISSYIIYTLISMSSANTAAFGPVVSNKVGDAVSVFALVFGVLAIIYFALVLAGKTSKGDRHVLFGYTVILFVLMALAKSYFDFYTTMNSPNKLLIQITLMLVMVYMLYELRFSLGNASPRGYAAVSLAAFYFTAVSGVPGIVAFAAGLLNKPEYLLCDLLALTFSVYIASRFAAYVASQNEN